MYPVGSCPGPGHHPGGSRLAGRQVRGPGSGGLQVGEPPPAQLAKCENVAEQSL